jgi:nucleoside-diphosphate-sugar epimerase
MNISIFIFIPHLAARHPLTTFFFIARFITAALAGRPLRLDAGGEQTRSFCYVADMVTGLIALMCHPSQLGPVNLGGDEEIKLNDLAQQILTLVGSASHIEWAPRRPDDPMQRKPDTSLATNALGWRPQVTLTTGLAALIHSAHNTSAL